MTQNSLGESAVQMKVHAQANKIMAWRRISRKLSHCGCWLK